MKRNDHKMQRLLGSLGVGLGIWTALQAHAAPDLSRLPPQARGAPGMVQAQTNTAPSVALTAPTDGTVVVAPASLTVSATASDAHGSIVRVDFYQGTTLLGRATTAPYQVPWGPVPAGRYSLTAVATNDRRQTATSAPVNLLVNAPPTVSLVPPNPLYLAPANLALTASASDTDYSIARVEFLANGSSLGTATAAPYTVNWNNVAAGTYSLIARATDDRGATTDSPAVSVTVNSPPSVALTSPAAGASFVAPAWVTLTAAAADGDGSIAKVDFLANGALVGSATTAPYSVAWETVAVGSVSLTAVATDNRGATTTSGAVAISIAANQAPAVTLTSPTAGQGFTAPATITLTASASDVDGAIDLVAFYGNDTLLGTVTTAPYSLTWANLEAGSYTVNALATDDHGGVMSSAPLTLTVGPTPTRIVYLHADHLGTPRLATDSNGTVIWRHDPLTEPFGNAPPEEDPDGDGVPFRLNLRFPGQYFDQETNLAYNVHRDYDASTGRYLQSDPLGLEGGINTYSYVGGNPISITDPRGLDNPGMGQYGSYWSVPPVAYNRPPPWTLPVSAALEGKAECIAQCLQRNGESCPKPVISGGAEGAPFHHGPAHPEVRAIDLGDQSNPWITDRPADNVVACARKCGFSHGWYENWPSVLPHWHFQVGDGGRVPPLYTPRAR